MKKFFLAADSFSFYLPEETSPMIVNTDSTMTRISVEDTPDVIFHNIDNFVSSNESVDFNVYIVPENTNICFYNITTEYPLSDNKPLEFDCSFTFSFGITIEQAKEAFEISKTDILDFFSKKDVDYIFSFSFNILEDNNDFLLDTISKELEDSWNLKLTEDYKDFIFIDPQTKIPFTEHEMDEMRKPQSQTLKTAKEININKDDIPF